MAGVRRGIIDVLATGGSGPLNAQELFKKSYDFFKHLESNSYCTEIALQYGSGGTGTDFHDGANPFGTNAFYVFEFPTSDVRGFSYQILMQWSDGTFGSSPGNPGLLSGGTSSGGTGNIGMSVAVALDSSGNPASPWNGTTAVNGTDTKGATVWAAPSGGSLWAWPRSNSGGGSHATNKENTTAWFSSSGVANQRVHFVGDRDAIYILYDPDDNNSYFPIVVSPYIPSGRNPQVFLAQFRFSSSNPQSDLLFGSVGGNSTEEGGVSDPRGGAQVYAFRHIHKRFYDVTNGIYGDENLTSDTGRLVLPEGLWVDDDITGLAGWFDVDAYGVVGSKGIEDVSPSSGPPYTHLAISTNNATDERWVFPWGANTAPNSTSTRDGTNF